MKNDAGCFGLIGQLIGFAVLVVALSLPIMMSVAAIAPDIYGWLRTLEPSDGRFWLVLLALAHASMLVRTSTDSVNDPLPSNATHTQKFVRFLGVYVGSLSTIWFAYLEAYLIFTYWPH